MADLLAGLKPESPKEAGRLTHELTNVEADQKAYEQMPESKETFLEQAEAGPTTTATPAAQTPVRQEAPPAPVKDEVMMDVEKIMEDGLGTIYASLPETAKPLFRKKGEEAAHEISEMVRRLKLEVSKVVRLIRDWLLTIPNVNKFFLEQEAKIKTDRLVDLVEARKEDLSKSP